jgi:uncharacterized membrane protein YkoI
LSGGRQIGFSPDASRCMAFANAPTFVDPNPEKRSMRYRVSVATMLLAALVACGGEEREENEADEAAEASAAMMTSDSTVQVTEETAGLFAKAAVSADSARALALAAVPGAMMTKGELEEEDGTLIYSFDLRVAGEEGVTEVHVDAMTGKVIRMEHEADEEEAAATRK